MSVTRSVCILYRAGDGRSAFPHDAVCEEAREGAVGTEAGDVLLGVGAISSLVGFAGDGARGEVGWVEWVAEVCAEGGGVGDVVGGLFEMGVGGAVVGGGNGVLCRSGLGKEKSEGQEEDAKEGGEVVGSTRLAIV